MPINSPGTLAFAPRGFEFQRSLSSTNPMINGVETFYWDPRLHGFSGDLAVSDIYTLVSTANQDFAAWVYTPATANQPARRTVFPCPIVVQDPVVSGQAAPGTNILGMTALGVIIQFRYYPATGNGNDPITVSNFNNGTAVYPGTAVEVDVLIDPHAVYRAQTYTPYGLSSILTSNNLMLVGSVNTYTVTLTQTSAINATPPVAPPAPSSFTFPLGEFTGPNPGSRAYVWSSNGLNQTGSTTSYVSLTSSANMLSVNSMNNAGDQTNASPGPTAITPNMLVRSIGLTKGIDGNNTTTATSVVSPYVYLDLSLVRQGFNGPNGFKGA